MYWTVNGTQETGYFNNALLDLLLGGGPGGGSNPCAGIKPNQLNYSSANGQQHIEERHMVWMNQPGSPIPMDTLPNGQFRAASQYLFDNPGTAAQNFDLVKQINATTFTSTTPVSSRGNLVFTFALPPQTPTSPLGYPPVRKYIGEEGQPSSYRLVRFQPTNLNTLVLKPDCKTVVTSYPGRP